MGRVDQRSGSKDRGVWPKGSGVYIGGRRIWYRQNEESTFSCIDDELMILAESFIQQRNNTMVGNVDEW
jgi:hypothetical protein